MSREQASLFVRYYSAVVATTLGLVAVTMLVVVAMALILKVSGLVQDPPKVH